MSPCAALKTIDIGDGLPELTLKNEKGEDVEVASLTAEKGVVFFLVPKADTRTWYFITLSEERECSINVFSQLDAPRKRAASATYILTLRPLDSTSTVSVRIPPQPRANGRPR